MTATPDCATSCLPESVGEILGPQVRYVLGDRLHHRRDGLVFYKLRFIVGYTTTLTPKLRGSGCG